MGFRGLAVVRGRFGEWSDEDAIRMEYRHG
jgi:hypothetical protein